MSLTDRITDLRNLLSSITLDGKPTILVHLKRAEERLGTATTDEAAGRPPTDTTWRDAVNETRSAMEHLFACIVRVACGARDESFAEDDASRPGKMRAALVEFGLVPPRIKDVIDSVYGAGSDKSAHPGIAPREDAELQIGTMLDVMLRVTKSYPKFVDRGFARAGQSLDRDTQNTHLARALHRNAAPSHPDLISNITVDENGIKQITGGVRPGRPPLHVQLTTKNRAATEKIRRAIEHGEAARLVREEGDEFAVEMDERLVEDADRELQPLTLTLGPARGRHVRLVTGEGSPGDVPFAEMVRLRMPGNALRLIIRSPHISHSIYFDAVLGSTSASLRLQADPGKASATHLRLLKLLRAASQTRFVFIRTLPEDALVGGFPLGDAVMAGSQDMIAVDEIEWFELLTRIERRLAITIPYDQSWTDVQMIAAIKIDELLQNGVAELYGTLDVTFDAIVARDLARDLLERAQPLSWKQHASRVFDVPGGPWPIGWVSCEMLDYTISPAVEELASIPEDAEPVAVRLEPRGKIRIRLLNASEQREVEEHLKLLVPEG